MPVNLAAPQAQDLLHVAGVFTQNRFCAAPVQVCREHLAAGRGIRVGRNDPCPCGSGKKYKQCHGKLS